MSLKDYLLASFLAELPEINKILPYKIDQNTSLISIRFENKQILSVYEIVNYNSSPEAELEFIRKAEPILKRQACSDEVRKKLLDVDVEFKNRYQDSGGKLILETLLTKSICSEIPTTT